MHLIEIVGRTGNNTIDDCINSLTEQVMLDNGMVLIDIMRWPNS